MFLLLTHNFEKYTPIFFLADCAGLKLERYRLYHFKNLPIVYNNDTMPVGPMFEAASTLYCGKGIYNIIDNLDDKLLISIHEKLINVSYMPDWLWEIYFNKRIEKESLLNLINEIRQYIVERGLSVPDYVHGWWYHWSHHTTLDIKNPETDKVAILFPGFNDAGQVRVIALPEHIFFENRYSFSKYGTAISVSENPQVLEGNYKPDPATLEEIKNWIIENHKRLLDDLILDLVFSWRPNISLYHFLKERKKMNLAEFEEKYGAAINGKFVGGNATGSEIQVPKFPTISGDLILPDDGVIELPENLTVNGNLNLAGTSICILNPHLTVRGTLTLFN